MIPARVYTTPLLSEAHDDILSHNDDEPADPRFDVLRWMGSCTGRDGNGALLPSMAQFVCKGTNKWKFALVSQVC